MTIMWEPSKDQKENSELFRYMKWLKNHYQISLDSFEALYNWSVDDSVSFWKSIIEFFQVNFEGDLSTDQENLKFLDYGWFPNTKLNFAQNLLEKGEDKQTALHFYPVDAAALQSDS